MRVFPVERRREMRYFTKNTSLEKMMTKKPIVINENMPASKALAIMNEKKITSLCVHSKVNKKKTIGIIHIHNLISMNSI